MNDDSSESSVTIIIIVAGIVVAVLLGMVALGATLVWRYHHQKKIAGNIYIIILVYCNIKHC